VAVAAPVPPKNPLSEQVLSKAQSSRDIVQDFVPLADSLEWELGQEYLRQRGNKAFLSDASPVPFVVNNDGTLSRHAAEVFFASLQEAEKAEPLEDEIFVLELGIGVGLFARFFLDHFRDLCQQHTKDYYDRLCYIAADRSERMLLDVLRHGVLGNHPGHYRVRQVDALEPERFLARDVMFRGQPVRLRAVFLNYLLECLPAAVLEIDGDKLRQACVRTCVARNISLADHTDLTLPMLQERAKSPKFAVRQELLEVYGLFASEYDYRPAAAEKIPHSGFAIDFASTRVKRFIHSFGAIQCLDKLLELLSPGGFVLMNEYGQSKLELDERGEHQRFSMATAIGLNFPLLEEYFRNQRKRAWLVAAGDEERGIHTRLLGNTLSQDTRVKFLETFQLARFQSLERPILDARECVKAGRFEMAASYYHEALRLQPANWVLLSEISGFLTFQFRDPKAGMDMAKVALSLNPTCSADLWNALGDGLYEFGRTAEARSAYVKALSVNDTDVRSRYNLAWVYSREKNFPEALAMIAEALAFDKTGAFRERLLQKQNEVLAHLTSRYQREYLLLVNLVSKYAKGDEKTGEAAPTIIHDHRD
jgi:tetratricopeptide (TPR) repeat protein